MKKLTIQELKKQYPGAYNFLTTHDMISLKEQRYDLENGDYVNVESYDTFSFDSRKYESHKKFLDIQYIIDGEENLIVEPIASLNIVDDYDSERDITFYQNDVKGEECLLHSGEMLLLEPNDGHMPCIAVNQISCHVKKAVFKLKIKEI